jgi:hypothetical protein
MASAIRSRADIVEWGRWSVSAMAACSSALGWPIISANIDGSAADLYVCGR